MQSRSPQSGGRALLWVVTEQPLAEQALVEDVGRAVNLNVEFCPAADVDREMLREPYDLVGVELGAEPESALHLISDVHRRLPQVTLFAVSADSSSERIRAAIDAGASDFLALPLDRAELEKALIKLTRLSARPAPARGAGEIVTLYGARGGLGVTTLAVNLAVRLADVTRARVALVDLDLQRGDVAAFLNLKPAQSLVAFPVGGGEIDELFLHQTLTRHPSGVSVLAAPTQIIEAEAVGHDKVAAALHLLRTQFPYTVIDTPRALTEATLPAFEAADRILVLTDLSVPGVRAAGRIIELLTRVGIKSEHLELLITEAIPGPVKVDDAARAIGKPPLFVLPRDDAAASQAMNAGAPLNGKRPAGLTAAITELAANLARVPEREQGRGVFGRLFGRARKDAQ